MRRTKAEAALTRQAILRSALAVFSTKGYSAARLEDVARLAGMTRGAIYWHFQGKAGLYQSLLETYSNRAAQVIDAALQEPGTFADTIRRLSSRLLIAVEEDRGLQAALELGLFKTDEIPELRFVRRGQHQASDDLLRRLAEAIRQAAARGEARAEIPSDAAARALLALLNGILQQWLLNPRSFSLREIGPHAADVFLSGLTRR